jgi:hypothetical protein|tara:strand:- start:518 stop:769 length:252 start_codon:yes stop_codon:yes gene_type:complete
MVSPREFLQLVLDGYPYRKCCSSYCIHLVPVVIALNFGIGPQAPIDIHVPSPEDFYHAQEDSEARNEVVVEEEEGQKFNLNTD